MTGWLIALAVCRALDAGTSIAAFNRGAPELVPWMPKRPAIVIAVHVGVLGGVQIPQLRALDKGGHPKLARTLAGIAAGTECVVGWNNWRIAR